MAFILMRMPCSEAEVERVFSRMRQIVSKRSVRIKRDLLEARLILQMNGSKMESGLRAALEGLERQDDARPPKWEATPRVPSVAVRPEFPVPMIFPPPRIAGVGEITPPGESSAALMPWMDDRYRGPIVSGSPK
jgi:hypothetical protein